MLRNSLNCRAVGYALFLVSACHALGQILSFAPPVTYTACPYPGDFAIADLNNDGFQDVVVSCNSSNTVAVFLGNGDGTLQPATLVTVGNGPYGVKAGDFNRDGKIDLAVANQFDNTISILLGNGNGTFQPQATIRTGNEPLSIVVGDWNGDRIADLAVNNYLDGTVGAYLGKGDGTFGSPTLTSVTGAYQLAEGDINKDGKWDIVVEQDIPEQLSDVTILLGNGDGTFRAVDVGQNFGDRPEGIAVADFNKDGKLDLAVGSELSDSVSVALGNGAGAFQALTSYPVGDYVSSVAISDFNGDGNLDIAIGGYPSDTVGVLLGKGDGTFLPVQRFASGGQSVVVSRAFLNRDLKPGLVAANPLQNTISVFLNNSN
jgi:hypothetical protein